MIIPGIHQPTAPFEVVINKTAWGKLSDRDRQMVELAAKLVTLESWMKIGHEDAQALEFYKQQGNEVIELDPAVQREGKALAVTWAEEQAKGNAWFKKVWDSQRAYEKLWENASSYRNVKYK